MVMEHLAYSQNLHSTKWRSNFTNAPEFEGCYIKVIFTDVKAFFFSRSQPQLQWEAVFHTGEVCLVTFGIDMG